MSKHTDAVGFIRQFFTDDIDATVDECAREMSGLDIRFHKSLISKIRLSMREQARQNQKPLLPTPPPLPPSPPKQYADKPPMFPPPEIPEVREKPEEIAPATIQVRRNYFDDILLNDSQITITKAMQLVKLKFGKSVDVGYAVSALKLARELHTQGEGKKEMPTKATEKVTTTKKIEAEKSETFIVSWTDEKRLVHYSNELIGKDRLKSHILMISANKEIDAKTIRVYRQLELELKINVNIGE